jgi:hypothetical protein
VTENGEKPILTAIHFLELFHFPPQRLFMPASPLHLEHPRLLESTVLSNELRFAREIDEYARLGAQNLGQDRLVQKIHGTELVCSEDFAVFVRLCGDEDDRRPVCTIALSDPPSDLETVHRRHVHIEKQEREIAFREQTQCGLPRVRGHHSNAELVEDRRERD